jgi:hypothetical protein
MMVLIVLYVDDLIIKGNNTKMVDELKGELHKTFEMKNLGLLHYCLVMIV